jgi:hypothetical protein
MNKQCVRMGCGNSVFYGLVCEICLTKEVFKLNKVISELEGTSKPEQVEAQDIDSIWRDR